MGGAIRPEERLRVLHLREAHTEARGAKDSLSSLEEPALLVPESLFLGHLLVQVPLLTLLSGHPLVVGGQAEDGSGPLICGRQTPSLRHGAHSLGP